MYKHCQLAGKIILLAVTLLFSLGALGQNIEIADALAHYNASIDELYRKADDLRKAGKQKEALAEIKQAVRFDPDCGKCFGLMSGIEGNLGRYLDGVGSGAFGEQKSKTPRHKAMSAYNRGFNLGGLNRISEALDSFAKSIEYDPTYELAHFGRGKTLYAQGDWAKSKVALEEAVKLDPKHGAAWAYLAEDQMNLGDAKAGLVSANRAVDLAPSDPRGFRARVMAHYWAHNYEAMLADATHVIELDPTRYHAHLFRGHALKLLGREEESAREYNLEPDKKAVEAGMRPPKSVDMRIYNCGDDSTELQSPANFNIDGFTACVERATKQLEQAIIQPQALPRPKATVPGLPTKRPSKR